MLYYTLQCIGWPNYKLLKPWTSNWKHKKWGWYIYNIKLISTTPIIDRHMITVQCTDWMSVPQADTFVWHSDNTARIDAGGIRCECILWVILWAMLGCLLLIHMAQVLLWHNFCHFCRNATVHGISNSLCAVTPLLLVAQGTAHRCEQINSKTRKGVLTFVQKLNQELAVLSIKRTQWAFLIDLPCLNP